MQQMIKRFFGFALLLTAATGLRAQDFDYFLLALTWTPSFCASEATDRDRDQCDPDRDLGFTLHGLWPQYEDGWPEYCDTSAPDPSRRDTGAMADIMGSGGLAWYQWKKHGRCTGLASHEYFQLARHAYGAVNLPQNLDDRMTVDELERAFMDTNDGLNSDTMVVTCRGDLIREVRICYDRSLNPRECSPDVLRSACRTRGELDLPPIP
jgi:ribonuclease T2